MRERNCALCEGHIVNGRCRDCGMNYRREKVYRLNGEIKMIQVGNRSGDQNKSRSGVKTEKLPGTQVRSRVESQMKNRTAGNTYRQKASTQVQSGTQRKTENWHPTLMDGKRVKKRSSISTIITVIVVIGIVSSAFEWFYRAVSDFSSESMEEVSTAKSSYDEYDYDPYMYVTEELSEKGDSVTQILPPGTYVGGSHLPEGRYEIKVVEGYGSVVLEDTDNTPYLWEYLAAEPISEDEKDSAEDFRLFTGWTLRVMPGVIIEVSSDNAQTDIQDLPGENPLDTAVKIQDGMIAGLDFPAGVYDIKAVSEYGAVSIMRGEQEIFNTFLEADTLSDSYQNFTLEINDEIVMDEAYLAEGFEVYLEPSAEIYSE